MALTFHVHAQSLVRSFPDNAYRGELMVTQPPVVQLNGQDDRLAPGVRIRGTNNLLVLSASLTGQSLTVNYTREMNGLIQNVWILNPEEAAQKGVSESTTNAQ